MKQALLGFSPVVKGKKQIASSELRGFLKDKRINLSCGHHFSIHNVNRHAIMTHLLA